MFAIKKMMMYLNSQNYNLDANGKFLSILEVKSKIWTAYITEDDLNTFKAVDLKEVHCFGWKQDTISLSLTVYEFVRRYKAIYFWVLEEVLKYSSSLCRAKIIIHFIKIASDLHKIGNLFSQTSITAALCDKSIRRLCETWKFVELKHLQKFNAMKEFVFDYTKMRNYLDNEKLPCIPPLGFYRLDLLFNNDDIFKIEKRPSNDLQLKNVIRKIQYFQTSCYGLSGHDETIWYYLSFISYDITMQNYLENKYSSVSQRLEPDLMDILSFDDEPDHACETTNASEKKFPHQYELHMEANNDVNKQPDFMDPLNSNGEKISKPLETITLWSVKTSIPSLSLELKDQLLRQDYLNNNAYDNQCSHNAFENPGYVTGTSVLDINKDCDCTMENFNQEIILEGKLNVLIIPKFVSKYNVPEGLNKIKIKNKYWVTIRSKKLHLKKKQKKRMKTKSKINVTHTIDLTWCFVGKINEKRFRIETINSGKCFIFQAENKKEANKWVESIQNQALKLVFDNHGNKEN